MGWTSYNASFYKNGKVDRKKECDNLFNSTTDTTTWEVLKSTMIGSTYYGAIKKTNLETNNSIIFGAIVKTAIDNSDYNNFNYKGMSETHLPYYYDCPASILKLLTPTENEWANEWRKRCYQKIENKKGFNIIKKLPLDTEITIYPRSSLINCKASEPLKVHLIMYRGRKIWICNSFYKYTTRTLMTSRIELNGKEIYNGTKIV